jgi:hypothetical protein
MGQFYRLAEVSKIFYDKELIETRKENERLKLTIFWMRYGVQPLREMMAVANECHPDAPRCACLACVVGGRYASYHNTYDPNCRECKFKPWFEQRLKKCEIDVQIGHPSKDINFIFHECNSNFVLEMDSHLVNMGRLDWNFFTYGSKFFKATTVEDPELQKIKTLFEELDRDD